MREGVFKDILDQPLTPEEIEDYQRITSNLKKALTTFDKEIMAFHERVMTGRHKPAKVLTMRPKGQ